MKKLLILISSFALLNCANPKPDHQAEFLKIQFKLTSSAIVVATVKDSNVLSVCVDSMKLCDDRFQILRLPEGDFYGKKVPGTTCLEFDLGNAFDLVTWEDFVILNICF
jgi:hypothetical protein